MTEKPNFNSPVGTDQPNLNLLPKGIGEPETFKVGDLVVRKDLKPFQSGNGLEEVTHTIMPSIPGITQQPVWITNTAGFICSEELKKVRLATPSPIPAHFSSEEEEEYKPQTNFHLTWDEAPIPFARFDDLSSAVYFASK